MDVFSYFNRFNPFTWNIYDGTAACILYHVCLRRRCSTLCDRTLDQSVIRVVPAVVSSLHVVSGRLAVIAFLSANSELVYLCSC